MNNKKIFVAGLAILAIVLMGSVAAVDMGILSGSPTKFSIDGIDFNIPQGYAVTDNYTRVNDTDTAGGSSYRVTQATFENNVHDAISVLVADYDHDMSEDIISQRGNKTTINGVDGYMQTQGDYTTFNYLVDGDLVTITLTNADLLEDIIVGNQTDDWLFFLSVNDFST